MVTGRRAATPPVLNKLPSGIVVGGLCAVIVGAGVAALVAPGNAGATSTETTRVVAAADSYVAQAMPNRALGLRARMQASHVPGRTRRIYLRFDLPSAPDRTIVGAQLVLTRTVDPVSGVVRLRRVADTAWHERTMTWRTAPAVGRTILDEVRTGPSMRAVVLHVPLWTLRNSSVSFAVTAPSHSGYLGFRSRESGAGAPQLRLTTTSRGHKKSPAPTPTTATATSASASTSPPPSTSVPPSTLTSSPAATSTSASVSDPPSQSTTTSASASASDTPSTSASAPAPQCTISAKLVPSCGYWWGIAPKAHTTTPRDVALAEDEQLAQTTFTLMHTYHDNAQLFPNATERSMAFETGKNRVLLINWKPATDMTWRAVANGSADARIDSEAAYINTYFPYPFFLTIWHEPENDLNQTTGSGMTAADYAAMFRHVVLRLRADGATKPVIVMNYMGFDNYALQSWFPQLWPGDDVVDWIGIDPYGSGTSGVYQSGDFNKLVNRQITGFPGYYTWATTIHPGKPIMLAEWGVNEGTNDPYGKANYLASVATYLPNYPWIKSLAYFDENMPTDTVAGTSYIDSSPQSLTAFQNLCDWLDAKGPHPTYTSGYVGLAG